MLAERQDWLAERERIPGVGASESAALFGLHPNISAFSLFEKLVNPRPLTEEEIEEESDVQSFGHAIEPYLADWYERKTKRLVATPHAPGVYRVKDKPFIFASPDRLLLRADPSETDLEKWGVLQLKSAIYFNESEPLPDYWQIQEQHEMLCVGVGLASFAILGGFRRRYHVDDIPANPAFHEILIERIELFMLAAQEGKWDRFGQELDSSEATSHALKRLYPRETGTAIQLPAEAQEWAQELERAKSDIKEIEDVKREMENKLRLAIGDSSYGLFEDGSGFKLTTTKGSTYTVTKDDYRTLRRFKTPIKGLLKTS